MAAWLVAADHCALAGAMQKRVTAAAAPHEHCPGHPAPSKNGSNEDLPCCKSLIATSVAPAKNVIGYGAHAFVAQPYFSNESLALWPSDGPIAESTQVLLTGIPTRNRSGAFSLTLRRFS